MPFGLLPVRRSRFDSMHSMGSKPLRTILEGHRTGQVALHLSGSRSVDNFADFVWVCDEGGQPVSALAKSKLTHARYRHIVPNAMHTSHVIGFTVCMNKLVLFLPQL